MVHIDRRRFGKDPPTKRKKKKGKETGTSGGENREISAGEKRMGKGEGENQIILEKAYLNSVQIQVNLVYINVNGFTH